MHKGDVEVLASILFLDGVLSGLVAMSVHMCSISGVDCTIVSILILLRSLKDVV